MRGTRYLSAWRHTVSDCGCTPATESNTQTAPSSTRSERSTSTVKSTWPGVSMILTRYFFPKRSHEAVVAALAILLHPVHGGRAFIHGTNLVGHTRIKQDALGRRRLSRVDVRHDPDIARVFEFEYPSHGPCRLLFRCPICYCFCHDVPCFLPAIMRESLVGFGHAVHVFFFLDGPAARVGCVDQFIRELVDHGLAGAFARILQKPANRQRLPPERVHFHGNLIVRAAHAPCLHFQYRLHVLHGFLENLQRVVIALLGHLVHGAVKHPLRRGLLAFPHHRADELLDEVAVVHRVVGLCAPADDSFAWHVSRSLLKSLLRCFIASYFCAALGRFAPYFDRP